MVSSVGADGTRVVVGGKARPNNREESAWIPGVQLEVTDSSSTNRGVQYNGGGVMTKARGKKATRENGRMEAWCLGQIFDGLEVRVLHV